MIFFHDGLLKYFSHKQSYKVFNRELFQHYCQYTYLESIHYDVVIKNDEDWKLQEKKG